MLFPEEKKNLKAVKKVRKTNSCLLTGPFKFPGGMITTNKESTRGAGQKIGPAPMLKSRLG